MTSSIRATRGRRASLAAASVVALSLTLTACGGGAGEADEADLGTVTFMAPLFDTAPAKDSPQTLALEKALGKKISMTWVPNAQYNDKLTVTLASDNLPEVLETDKTPAFVQSAESGAFWDLTDKLKDYPNLAASDPQKQLNASVNGKVYGIYRDRDTIRSTVMIRKDWLENLGLEVPTTVDELAAVAKAFTEQDPDGNGKDDTYGLILPKWPGSYGSASPYDVVETWFGAPNAWGEEGGKITPGFDSPAFLKANEWFHDLISSGYTNPDYATLDAGNWNDPFVQGKGGIIIDTGSRGLQIQGLMDEADPDNAGDHVVMTGNLIGPTGERLSYPTPGYSGFLAISKQSVPTEAELDDVLTVLDRMNDEDVQNILNNGVEGTDYEVVDGYSKMLDGGKTGEYSQIGTAVSGYTAYKAAPAEGAAGDLAKQRDEQAARDAETAVANPALALDSPTYATQGVTLNQIISDARIQYLSGQIDEDGLKAAIARWHSSGGDKVIDEMTDLYAKASK